jgi:magnesium transporter
MNFVNMPETRTGWGYFAALGVMGAICALLYWRFRRLGWLP